MNNYLAVVPQPAEKICAEELCQISGVQNIQIAPGIIFFEGLKETLYRVNLWSRCANRILVKIADFPCNSTEELYEQTYQIPWADWININSTFAVRIRGSLPQSIHSFFGSLRIKDAIADQFCDRFGTRPSVDTDQPIFQIHAQFYQEDRFFRCVICLDSSGNSLSYRGYRTQSSLAPLRENLASIILNIAKYPQMPACTPVVDPFCGSGTFLIEAGEIAYHQAPGLQRTFAFQNWPTFDKNLWIQIQTEALELRKEPTEQFLFGFDQNRRAIELSTYHAEKSGVHSSIVFQQKEISTIIVPTDRKGIVICNPPYGKRLGQEENLIPLYRTLGDILKKHFSGWTAYVFTASLPLSHQIGLRPQKRHILFNGPLEGRLLEFNLY